MEHPGPQAMLEPKVLTKAIQNDIKKGIRNQTSALAEQNQRHERLKTPAAVTAAILKHHRHAHNASASKFKEPKKPHLKRMKRGTNSKL